MAKQSKTQNGRVVKAVASKFFVDTGDDVKVCFARKKLKFDGNIFVGDYVEIAKDRDVFVIESVEERKNQLIRPYVSNVDVCLIVIASEPEPDFVLVDKVIINCLEQNIEPVLVANKSDIALVDLSEYHDIVKVFHISAENGIGVADVFDYVEGKTVCLAGQSAVGKSSLINAILDSDECEIGELAKKCFKTASCATFKTVTHNVHTKQKQTKSAYKSENVKNIKHFLFLLINALEIKVEKLHIQNYFIILWQNSQGFFCY